jgi:hypothetical protein
MWSNGFLHLQVVARVRHGMLIQKRKQPEDPQARLEKYNRSLRDPSGRSMKCAGGTGFLLHVDKCVSYPSTSISLLDNAEWYLLFLPLFEN